MPNPGTQRPRRAMTIEAACAFIRRCPNSTREEICTRMRWTPRYANMVLRILEAGGIVERQFVRGTVCVRWREAS